MTLSKQTWDKVQIIQNDLLLWQPRIIAQLEQDQDRTNTSTTGSMSSEPFRTPTYRHYSDMESSYTSVLSQSHERLGQSQDPQNPSLFSVIAVMSDGKTKVVEWGRINQNALIFRHMGSAYEWKGANSDFDIPVAIF